MKRFSLVVIMCAVVVSGCDSSEAKKAQHLASLTCDSSREHRSQEELQAIGDACFRSGSFTKSSGYKW